MQKHPKQNFKLLFDLLVSVGLESHLRTHRCTCTSIIITIENFHSFSDFEG